jgi:pimeloyl-ACP methyl ester carboxylesterase
MQALGIERPVLVGHSIAGQELNSIGSRFPNKVSGLIYLDPVASRSFYDPAHTQVEIEMNGIKKRIEEIEAGGIDEQEKLRELETAIVSSRPFFTRAMKMSRRCHHGRRSGPRSTLARRSSRPSPSRSWQCLPALTIGATS